MTTTQSIETIGIMAARIGGGDTVEIDGQFRTVDDYSWTADRRIRWEFTDGSTATVAPHYYVTAVA